MPGRRSRTWRRWVALEISEPLFRALVGGIPGGTAVVCAVLCSFFTVFTGGSGVTILALGGVLFPALIKDGYRDRFALGRVFYLCALVC